MRIKVLNVFLSIYMFCSHERQIRLLSINIDFCQFYSLVDSSFITLWIQGTSHGFEVYYLKTNSLVSVN